MVWFLLLSDLKISDDAVLLALGADAGCVLVPVTVPAGQFLVVSIEAIGVVPAPHTGSDVEGFVLAALGALHVFKHGVVPSVVDLVVPTKRLLQT
jgi:hypothetical protein